ncbi:MAG TPA: serine/threonine-protein kinase [Gemmataceae bacterium]|jgi:serine/threonine-protein kinase|nr:serine/threonine-protein kinase [Gemmataceae bacterium]
MAQPTNLSPPLRTADVTVAPTGRRESTSIPLPSSNSELTNSLPGPDHAATLTSGGAAVIVTECRNIAGYEILEELGRGGMGIVYKARHIALKRVVALKMILAGAHARSKDLERFRAEAEAVARFQHPNIVQIHEVGEADGLPYFSLEFVEYGTLSKKIARDPQEPRYAAETVEALARAMQYAHERGVIHRDLKPSNILLADGGVPKITDFGLAKRFDDESERTQTGQVLGTPSYMAPEQASADFDKVGPPTDVYALGATLYDLLTGRPPFSGSSVLDTLEMVRTREPVPPGSLAGHVPRDLETICLKCLQKDPARRYTTAGALADDLRSFLDGKPIKARPVGSMERAWRWAKRNPWLAAMGSAVAILLVAVATITSVLSYNLSIQKRAAEDTAIREQAAREEAQRLERLALAEQKKAEKARDQETAARKTSAEQRQLALNTVRDVLIRVDELMKKDERLVPIRLDIIRQMVTNVDQIRDHALKNPLEDNTEALAYTRIGQVYFSGNRITDAVEWLTKAHVILKRMAEEAPNDKRMMRDLAAACQSLADAEWRLGHGSKSRALQAEALRLQMRRAELIEKNGFEMEAADAALEVAEAYARVAYDDLRLGRPADALRNYLASEKSFEALPPPLPQWLKVRRIRSESRVRIGDALSRLGRTDEAQKSYLDALSSREELLQNTRPGPNAVLLKTDVGQSRMYLGDFFLMARNDATTASLYYGQCFDIFQAALADNPQNLDIRQRLAATYYRLGLVAGQRHGIAALAGAAIEIAPQARYYAECLKMREELAKIDKTDMQGQVEVLLSYARVGRIDDVDETAKNILKQAGTDPQSLFQTACGLSIVGGGTADAAVRCRDQAFEVLDKLIHHGWEDRFGLNTDPDLDAVRRDPRYKELLKKMDTLIPEPG